MYKIKQYVLNWWEDLDSAVVTSVNTFSRNELRALLIALLITHVFALLLGTALHNGKHKHSWTTIRESHVFATDNHKSRLGTRWVYMCEKCKETKIVKDY